MTPKEMKEMEYSQIMDMIDADWIEANPWTANELITWMRDELKRRKDVIDTYRAGSLLANAIIESLKEENKKLTQQCGKNIQEREENVLTSVN